MLHRLETFALFAAMLLAIVLEAGCVYWTCHHRFGHEQQTEAVILMGDWSGPTLPQCWLIGALLVLLYRAIRTAAPPTAWTLEERSANRHSFFRLWRLAITLLLLQGLNLYLAGKGTL